MVPRNVPCSCQQEAERDTSEQPAARRMFLVFAKPSNGVTNKWWSIPPGEIPFSMLTFEELIEGEGYLAMRKHLTNGWVLFETEKG